MFEFLKKKNPYLKFAHSYLFNEEASLLLDDFQFLIFYKLQQSIEQRFGGDHAMRLLREQKRLPFSSHRSKYSKYYYLLFFHEIYKIERKEKDITNELHQKYLERFIGLNTGLLTKFGADLKEFINDYYRFFLLPLERKSGGIEMINRKVRIMKAGVRWFGYSVTYLSEKDRDFMSIGGYKFDIEQNDVELERIHKKWTDSFRPKRGAKSEYYKYCKKLRNTKSAKYLAKLVLEEKEFKNPTKIKVLIHFCIIILERKTKRLEKEIEQENLQRIRPGRFFSVSFEELSEQIDKKNGNLYQQLGVDLNALVMSLIKEDDYHRKSLRKDSREKVTGINWQALADIVHQLGFRCRVTEDGRIERVILLMT